MGVENKKKQNESGHAKNIEAFGKMIAYGEMLDQARLNPPDDLTIDALRAMYMQGAVLQGNIGNSRADWRTIALARAQDIDKFVPLAAQAVGQLAARGASRETIADARGYVKKLQGKRAGKKAADAASTPGIDESAKGVSASQQSSTQSLAQMSELIDFLEAQNAYASVTQAGLKISDMRSFVDAAQAKHDGSIAAVAALSNDRNERDKFYYINPDSIHTRMQRYKELVKGAYGAGSVEYKTVRAFEFKKR